MEILEFVKSAEVDPVYFESSYYMLPEEAGRRPYALLTKALEESEYVAIAKLTMHNREYTVFLRPHKGGMMLHTMYYKEEVREVEGYGAPDVEIKEAEIKVAHQLIEALADEWDPDKYHDDFQDNLKKLIETKLEGGTVQAVEQPKKLAPVVDLMAALKESLENAKKPAASEKRVAREAVREKEPPRIAIPLSNLLPSRRGATEKPSDQGNARFSPVPTGSRFLRASVVKKLSRVAPNDPYNHFPFPHLPITITVSV